MRPTRDVPCGSCTLCCQSEAIILHPEDGDDPGLYETITVEHPLKPGLMVYMIKPRENGSTACRYLGPFGCSIHAKRPVICREFDCRGLARRAQSSPLIKYHLGDNALMHPLIVKGLEMIAKEQK